MTNIHIICVGKLKEPFYIQAVAEYAKRLSPYCRLTIVELPEEKLPQEPSQAQIDAALLKEAEAIRGKLPPSSRVVALCVEGRLCSSEDLARTMACWASGSAMGLEKRLVFLIGGSRGLHPSVKAQAWAQMSMSPMTFPHHLARVMLLEQIYRAYQINQGSAYHK